MNVYPALQSIFQSIQLKFLVQVNSTTISTISLTTATENCQKGQFINFTQSGQNLVELIFYLWGVAIENLKQKYQLEGKL